MASGTGDFMRIKMKRNRKMLLALICLVCTNFAHPISLSMASSSMAASSMSTFSMAEFLGQVSGKVSPVSDEQQMDLSSQSEVNLRRLRGFGTSRKIGIANLLSYLRKNNAALSGFEQNLSFFSDMKQIENLLSKKLRISVKQGISQYLQNKGGQAFIRQNAEGKLLPTSINDENLATLIANHTSSISSLSSDELISQLLKFANLSLQNSKESELSQIVVARAQNIKEFIELSLLKNNSTDEAHSEIVSKDAKSWNWIFDSNTPPAKIQFFAQIMEARATIYRALSWNNKAHVDFALPNAAKLSEPTPFNNFEETLSGTQVSVDRIQTGQNSHWRIQYNFETRLNSKQSIAQEYDFQMDLAQNISDLRGIHFRTIKTDYLNPQFGLVSSSISFMTSILAERKDKVHMGVIDSFKKQFEVENRKCRSERSLVLCHYNEKLITALSNSLNVFEYSQFMNRPEVFVRGR